MIALKITDIKNFMGRLLLKDDFDLFLTEKAEVLTSYEMSLSGRRNLEWYDSDVSEKLVQEMPEAVVWMTWGELKNNVFEFIKGKQSPVYLRLSFRVSGKMAEEFMKDSGILQLYLEQMPELHFQVRYERKELVIVSGISFPQFTLDKSLERAWDEMLSVLLKKKGISCEEYEES